MGKNFYIFSNGRIRRKQNTVFLETKKDKIPIPVEEIDQIFVFGEADFNTKFLNFLSTKGITLHVFNYYGFYSGSFYPRETLLSGTLVVKQVEYYKDNEKFKLGLEKYLEEGKFYQCTKEESRKYFLQSDDVGSRDKLLHDALSKIKSSETCDNIKA